MGLVFGPTRPMLYRPSRRPPFTAGARFVPVQRNRFDVAMMRAWECLFWTVLLMAIAAWAGSRAVYFVLGCMGGAATC